MIPYHTCSMNFIHDSQNMQMSCKNTLFWLAGDDGPYGLCINAQENMKGVETAL